MNQIKDVIINHINSNNGYITLDNFIYISMYDENFGYYISKNPIGEKNDFITSPEISQLFGEIIGLYILDYWNMNINKSFNLFELGPGKGTMMRDILNISSNFPNYVSKINLKLIEKNHNLIIHQKKILNEFNNKLESIKWYKDLNNFDDTKNTIFIANEFFDCFPIKQIYKFKDIYYEKIVRYDISKNKFQLDNILINKYNPILKKIDYFDLKNDIKDGTILEISNLSDEYIFKISDILLNNEGIIVLFDYGNNFLIGKSTIKSIKNHKHSEILDNPGHQDISYMINFSYIKNLFISKNLYVYGPFNQGDFFKSLGIKQRKDNIIKTNLDKKNQLENGLNRIIDNDKMGKLFKVLIASSKKIKLYEN